MTQPILLIEDNMHDVVLIKEALSECPFPGGLAIVSDGEAALDYLRSDRPKPSIILLDLNLPRMSGLELLIELKQDPNLKVIPVIVLTNSRSEDDVISAYAAYCNAYVRKPLGYEKLLDVISSTKLFWLDSATLPNTKGQD